MSDTFYVTTPIYYVNSEPHLGHAYTTILGDVLTRFHRLRGLDARFQTGTDEHGEKIAQAARARGMTPQAFVDEVSGKFRSLWEKLGLEPTTFIRTTDEAHRAVVRRILEQVHASGDIYFDHYDGLYCVGCERYVTEKELVDGKCPDHDREPEKRSESNWFFRMEKYRTWLRQYILDHPDYIQPEGFRRETLALLEEPIGDLSISRPKERVPWGIPIPWDTNHVTYVWFDALINYISGLGWPDGPDFARFWHASTHLIAKDILKPHCVFWPCMLKAAGIEPYRAIRIHGYWLTDQGKMSKSRGNVVKPLDLADTYGLDAFRYFLMRDITFGRDATFSELALAERVNSDLANDLGNLLNRTVGMVERYHQGIVHGLGDLAPADIELRDRVLGLAAPVAEAFAALRFSQGVESVLEVVRAANRYIDSSEPWRLAKVGDDGRLRTVLACCAELLRVVSILLQPVMPWKMVELRRQLGLDAAAPVSWDCALVFPGIPAATAIAKGEPLFPRVDLKVLRASLADAAGDGAAPEVKPVTETPAAAKPVAEKGTASPVADTITFDELMKVKLIVARIERCEKVEGADKLLRCELDAGAEGRPTVVAGLAPWYPAETMVGKTVLWVANLAPRKMRGIMSQGMLLAVDTPDGGVRILEPSADAAPGTRAH